MHHIILLALLITYPLLAQDVVVNKYRNGDSQQIDMVYDKRQKLLYESPIISNKDGWTHGYSFTTSDVYYDLSSIRLAKESIDGIDKDTTISIKILQVKKIAVKGKTSLLPAKKIYKSFGKIPFEYILAYGPKEHQLYSVGSINLPTNDTIYTAIKKIVLELVSISEKQRNH